MGETPIFKGVGKITGDGWKDTTKLGEVVFVWNAELPPPYAPGQFPRLGNPIWSASADQYDFTPASVDDLRELIDQTLATRETLVSALRDLCDAWDTDHGGEYRGNVTRATAAARTALESVRETA
jgi:hypothetical protein